MNDKFPDPVNLPHDIEQARKERCLAITRSVKLGTGVRLFIICMEFTGVAWYGSAALLLDAFATCVDVLSSILLIVFIRMANEPPDEDHPFGHGRYEPLAGLCLGILLIVIGVTMIIRQSSHLYTEESYEMLASHLWLIPTFAVALLEMVYRYLKKIALQTKSPALFSEVAHFRVDIVTSLIALLALGLVSIYPQMGEVFDYAGAAIIAFFMIGLGASAAKENVGQLMDKKPDEKYFDRVKCAARRAEGVRDVEKIKIQLFGPDAHVSVDIEVDPDLSVFEAHKISQHVRAEIQKDWPVVRDVIVHIEPYFPNDH